MNAMVFPGQGAQSPGMAKDLYDAHASARRRFEEATELLGFDISKIMFEGEAEDLKQTNVTQPAIFLHSVILAEGLKKNGNFAPDLVAGHSLGEFSALVAAGAMSFSDGLQLVAQRAEAMQAACAANPSTMAAILGLDDAIVEEICATQDGIVVPANYNCPGQLVISGEVSAVEAACEALKEAGARRALLLPVGGAFHSPLMEPARAQLEQAIASTPINAPVCPIVQNVTGLPETDPEVIRTQLVAQLTAPVRWTQTMHTLLEAGVTEITEVGPGKVLQGLFKKVDRSLVTASALWAS
ncbi:MAG: ACP S-malonyltransferase [Flavobacteriales bacterium]|nr:ACP S-malonyltransferase [Flavobacteriales bacterium]